MDIKKRKLTSIIAISLLTVLILFVSAIFYISEPKSASAAVLNNTNSDILTNDLLLSDYTTRGDGSVFNGNVLLDIYKRVTGNENATYANIETDARNTSGKNTNITMHSGKDAKQIKTNNKNKNIVVTLGGMQWMVTSLTTNDSNEPVLTLWLKDNGDSSV